ncbi:hypothetical protein [Desulfurobacterium sp.]|uniref:hypothetical protein n=1 Tax=Desulfurobacterium sp. TaxID=2004706 RepID=UPI00261B1D79|nr:hypothetical protein [Desulfurobacterium sp.]
MKSKSKSKNKLTLAYETFLPRWSYPYFRRLLSIHRTYGNILLKRFWSEEWIERLKNSNNPWKPIDEATARPKHIPSRVWRNICLTVGSVLKSSAERKDLIEKLLAKPHLIDAPAHKAVKELGYDRLFVENVQEQLRNYRAKHGKLPGSFFELGVPRLKGIEFPTGADDSIGNGQFKKLQIANGRYYLKIKLPVTWRKWRWFTIEGAVPKSVLAHLETVQSFLRRP